MYLITGCKGQLGQEIAKLLPEAICADVDILDITDLDAVLKFVKENNVDTIINCAAYTAVDKAEDEEDFVYKINVLGPENLAKTGAKIIHISTDYVFDGNGHRPYKEDDVTKPISVYGRTKRAGEEAVLKNASCAAVIRTAWLYSSHGNNFVKTMCRLGSERETLSVVYDQIGTPTFAEDLAKAVVDMLPNLNKETSGIYHYTNEGVCSWYDFSTEIMQLMGLNCCVKPILSSAYPTKAQRPFYSVLDKTKIKETFGIEIPHWKESLKRCLKQF